MFNLKHISGTIKIPTGTTLAVLIHDLHRDPNYWEDPDKVIPERFMPENMKNRDPNAFIPFSLGPMDCLGTFRLKCLPNYFPTLLDIIIP